LTGNASADHARKVNSRRRREKPAVAEQTATGPPPSKAVMTGNCFGLVEAMFGILAGFVLAALAVSVFAAPTQHGHHASQYGEEIVSLVGLWIGLTGAVLAATRLAAREQPGRRAPDGDVEPGELAAGSGTGSVVRDYGLKLRPWPDIPLGIVAGVASQYLLVPVVEAPLLPFVRHLYTRLGHPAQSLTNHAFGPGLVVLAVLVCLGSPVVEELFFRGLLLRALTGSFKQLGPRLAPAASIAITALVFALVHFEALQFLGLAGFGAVLGILAWRTGRLGPSIVAHMTFNTVTIIAIVVAR
jgi:membrane protease YdiL (CAAX protease family)